MAISRIKLLRVPNKGGVLIRCTVSSVTSHFSMVSFKVSDQLRSTYRFYHWLKNRKWWWGLLFWTLVVMLQNAYVVNGSINKE